MREKSINRFRRDAWLEINLGNLEYNFKKLAAEFGKPLIPVLKADAYGHGAEVIVKVLDSFSEVAAYAVASVDEALALRNASKTKIMVLGICPSWSIEPALAQNIELTIASQEAAETINKVAEQKQIKAKVHIKLDTGMNRIGFKQTSLDFLQDLKHLEVSSVYTHFADVEDMGFCQKQKHNFDIMTKNLNYPKHLCSTVAARKFKSYDYDFVRCGIELYGLENPSLKALLSLFARISFIKEIQAGESVSYKRTWTAHKDTRIATLPLGYADGVPRKLSNQIYGYCHKQKVKQVGTITMDQMMFDLGDNQEIKAGDIVELIGLQTDIGDWCKKLDTISYELVAGLNLRLPKSYTR